ncbi:hypothetical protein [Lysinibacillus piscis]|uniref:Uncharacterized protein n=1 Tax=Lysinibacillus piscis TaxID=2518931 RepID=A0ABQ5NMH5_9BACI|nr:hypothetical protein [Lysinibacillus sp. KH24]GLC89513.1 hypothetical protein LYSBPC_26400 [Lysinibacillus sp. KH24]
MENDIADINDPAQLQQMIIFLRAELAKYKSDMKRLKDSDYYSFVLRLERENIELLSQQKELLKQKKSYEKEIQNYRETIQRREEQRKKQMASIEGLLKEMTDLRTENTTLRMENYDVSIAKLESTLHQFMQDICKQLQDTQQKLLSTEPHQMEQQMQAIFIQALEFEEQLQRKLQLLEHMDQQLKHLANKIQTTRELKKDFG